MFERALAVTCYVGPAQNLYHLSKVLTGLSELAGDGQIELRFKPVSEDAYPSEAEAVIHALVANEAQCIHVAFDVYDHSNRFETAFLEQCALYFKRSFYRPDILSLPAAWQDKIVPFGLNYGCRSTKAETRLLESHLQETSLKNYRCELAFSEFEQNPSAAVAPSIVFQTRAWAPESTSDNVEDVNGSRARIIRALREAFPGRFHGGFDRNLHGLQGYPNLLTEHPYEQGEYLRLSKRCLIGISSRGLHHSVPFKVPEYMAASIAIVSEPLRNELPAPFVPGRDFLEFHTPEECVEQCDRILSSPSLAGSLREASWRYYERQVRPARHLANLLERALGYGTPSTTETDVPK